MKSNMNPAMRLFFFVLSSVILLGIWLTGFNNVHWLLYLPVALLYMAAVIGFCPGLHFSGMVFPAKTAKTSRKKKR